MNRQEDTITDEGHPGKYFHYMLNMADDDLGPYEYRLLGHYRRVCGVGGKCTQSVRDIAAICQMSAGMVTKARTKLAVGGWITAKRLKEKGADVGYIVTVIDRMKENTERYADKGKGVHVVNTPVHTVNEGVHVVKQRINKKEESTKDIAPASQTAPKPRPRNLYFDAIVEAFKFDVQHLTKTEASGIGKVANELKTAGYAPEDIAGIYAYCKAQKFDSFTPAALTKHAGAWRAKESSRVVKMPSVAMERPAEPTPEELAESRRLFKEAREARRVSQ